VGRWKTVVGVAYRVLFRCERVSVENSAGRLRYHAVFLVAKDDTVLD
jgi:hypothetical protein